MAASTTFQRILIAAALAAVIGVAFIQTKRAAASRAEAQDLRAGQASLSEQISNLQAVAANLTNQLADARAENPALKNKSAEMELLKLRGEVTRLRPLQDDVVALQKMLRQSSAGLAEWKTNEIANVGRANPIDALQTYIYLSKNFDPAKIQDCIVGDSADPPDAEALQNFIKSKNDHPGDFDATSYKILSQNWLAPNKVQVELQVLVSDGMGMSAPFTLQNINGEWKVVVFNNRDQNGNFVQIGFTEDSRPR